MTTKSKLKELLIWSQKYTQTDMVYLASGGFWLSAGQVATTLLSFVSAIVFANFISKEVYGNYKYILSATSILGALSLTGMGTLVIQAVARGAEGMVKDAMTMTFRWSILVLLASLMASGYYTYTGNGELAIAMIAAGIFIPFINSFSYYGNYFAGKKNFRLNTGYNVTLQVLNYIVVLTAAIFSGNILIMVWAHFAINATFNVLAYFYVKSRYQINSTRDTSLLSFGKHISLMNVFGVLANQLDKVLVFGLLGPVNLAIYAFGQAIPEQLKGAFKSLFSLALPKYATLSHEDLRISVIKKTKQLTLLATLLATAYILSAPLIFRLLFPQYGESVIYSQIYILGMIAIPGISLFSTYFQLTKATSVMYRLSIWSNAITVILAIILIKYLGIMGAVIENGTSWAIMLAMHWYYFNNCNKNTPAK